MEIVIVRDRKIAAEKLTALVAGGWGNMAKFVVDVAREVIAVGGEMYADAEAVLIEDGSRQDDLGGGERLPRPATGAKDRVDFLHQCPAPRRKPEHGDPGA